MNWEQNNWAWLLLMTEFAYNNSKNASTSHTLFELNCGYHFCVSLKKKFDAHSKFSSVRELAIKLKKLMDICYQNLLYAQDLQKQAHDKNVKFQSYALGEKV